MNDQRIFEMLQDIEGELFHKCADMASTDPGYEAAKEAHAHARAALLAFFPIIKKSED